MVAVAFVVPYMIIIIIIISKTTNAVILTAACVLMVRFVLLEMRVVRIISCVCVCDCETIFFVSLNRIDFG